MTDEKVLDMETVQYDTDKVFLKRSKETGKGVFLKHGVKAGDIIERFPLIPLQFKLRYHSDPSILMNTFEKKCDCQDCTRHGNTIFLGGGYSNYYNFVEVGFNASYDFHFEEYYGNVIAKVDMPAGQQVALHLSEAHHYYQAVAREINKSLPREMKDVK